MRKMLEKNGFVCCGVIYLIGGPDNGKAGVAYELNAHKTKITQNNGTGLC